MEIQWTNSKWSAGGLHGRSVEFQIPVQERVFHGIGEFLVRQNPEGQIAVEILCDTPGSSPSERIQKRFSIPALAVDLIEAHPDSSVALFRLSCS